MFSRFLRVLMIAIAILCVGAFAGCTTISSALQSPSQTIEASCTGVGIAVQVLAVAERNGKLNATTEKTIDGLIAVTEPICTAPNVPSLTDTEKTLFVNAAAQLATLAANYQQSPQGVGVLK